MKDEPLEHGCHISPTAKAKKPTFGSVTQIESVPVANDQLCSKKRRVDPRPATLPLDLISEAILPFRPLFSPLLASHAIVGSILDSLHHSSIVASVGTDAKPPLPIGIVLHVITSTSNISILSTTLDSNATESNADSPCANLVAMVVEGLDAAEASTLDALVGDVADGECD